MGCGATQSGREPVIDPTKRLDRYTRMLVAGLIPKLMVLEPVLDSNLVQPCITMATRKINTVMCGSVAFENLEQDPTCGSVSFGEWAMKGLLRTDW